MRNYYLVLELLPVCGFIYAHYCEKHHSNYPNTSKGYPNKRIKKSRQGWEVGNQIMAQAIKSVTTIMILLNATLINLLMIGIGIYTGEKQLRVCINEKGIVMATPKVKVKRYLLPKLTRK